MAKKNYFKQGGSKVEQNDVAEYLSVRSGACIDYDPKQLLVINDNCKVEKIFVEREEDYFARNNVTKRVTILLRGRAKGSSRKHLIINTSLVELENKLRGCNSSRDIDALQEEYKKQANKDAFEESVRCNNHITYDRKHLLVINSDSIIEEIYVKDDEDYDMLYSDEKLIRIVFTDKVNHPYDDDERKFTMDIPTTLSLSQFEKKVAKCNSEVEIEDLCE